MFWTREAARLYSGSSKACGLLKLAAIEMSGTRRAKRRARRVNTRRPEGKNGFFTSVPQRGSLNIYPIGLLINFRHRKLEYQRLHRSEEFKHEDETIEESVLF